MMNSLHKWLSVLSDSVLDLMKTLPLNIQDQMKDKIAQYIKNYERKDVINGENKAGGDSNNTPQKKMKDNDSDNNDMNDEDDFSNLKSMLPLPEGVLKINLGIPIIVLCNKVDLMMRGEKSQFLEQNLEFIQKNVRQMCLSYGASMVFTDSVYQLTNLEQFYRYLLHRLYDLESPAGALQVLSKDSIFIPTGYDSLLLIDALCKGTAHENKIFEEVIKKPS